MARQAMFPWHRTLPEKPLLEHPRGVLFLLQSHRVCGRLIVPRLKRRVDRRSCLFPYRSKQAHKPYGSSDCVHPGPFAALTHDLKVTFFRASVTCYYFCRYALETFLVRAATATERRAFLASPARQPCGDDVGNPNRVWLHAVSP
jgi:hypothetical protein